MATAIFADLAIRLSTVSAELTKGLAQAKNSVNGFGKNMKAAGKEMSGFFKDAAGDAMSSINIMTGGMSSLLSAAVKTFTGMTAASASFTAAFIATGIGAVIVAVVAALGALYAAFKRNGDAADALERGLAVVKGVFTWFIDNVAQLGLILIEAFTNPQQALEDLKTNFKNTIDIFVGGWEVIKNGALGTAYAIAGIFSPEAKKKSEEYFQAAADGAKKVGDAFKNVGKNIKDNIDKSTAIADLENSLNDKKIKALGIIGAAQRKLADIQEKVAETDASTTEGKLAREKLIAEAVQQQQTINNASLGIAKAELDLLTKQIAQRTTGKMTDEDALTLAQKKAEIDQLIYDNQKKISSLKKRDTQNDARLAAETAKAAADAAKVAAEEAKKQQDILNETRKMKQEFMLGEIEDAKQLAITKANIAMGEALQVAKTEEQKRLIRMKNTQDLAAIETEFAQKAIDENQKVADAKKKTDEEEMLRKQELMQQNFTAASDTIGAISAMTDAAMNAELAAAGDNEAKKDAIRRKYARKQKALSIVQAIINGAEAVTKVLAQTGVLSPFVLPAIIAATASQVALIASQPLAKGGIASGPTLATVGEYPGAKSNPEVIAPLNKLKSLLGIGNSDQSEVRFVIEQNQLVGILKNYDNKNIYF